MHGRSVYQYCGSSKNEVFVALVQARFAVRQAVEGSDITGSKLK